MGYVLELTYGRRRTRKPKARKTPKKRPKKRKVTRRPKFKGCPKNIPYKGKRLRCYRSALQAQRQAQKPTRKYRAKYVVECHRKVKARPLTKARVSPYRFCVYGSKRLYA